MFLNENVPLIRATPRHQWKYNFRRSFVIENVERTTINRDEHLLPIHYRSRKKNHCSSACPSLCPLILPGQSASGLEIETWSYNCPLGKSDIPRALKLSRLNRRVRHNAPSPWPFFFPLFFFFFSFSLFPFFPLPPFSSSSFFFFLHCPNPWHQRKETGDIEEDLDRDDLSHIHTAIIYPRATSSSLCKVRRIDKKGAYLISELSHPSSPGWHNLRFKRYLIRNGGVTGFFSDCRSRFNVYGKYSSFFSSWI